MKIPYGEWMPDAPDVVAPLTAAENAVAVEDGYVALRGTREADTGGAALNARCQGAFSTNYESVSVGSPSTDFAGTSNRLYRMTGSTWSNVSNGGGSPYTCAAWWDFALIRDKVIAVAGSAATDTIPQVWQLGVSAAFADLGGSPPRAATTCAVRDFVVMGNLYESAAHYPNLIRWSGLGDETAWTASAATQSDSQVMALDGGPVTKVIGGDVLVVFQKSAITVYQYVGPPVIFALAAHFDGIGAPCQKSIIEIGDAIYFYSSEGFYCLRNHRELVPIGNGKVDKFIAANVRGVSITTASDFIAAYDDETKSILWLYNLYVSGGGTPTSTAVGVIYSIRTGKWTSANFAVTNSTPQAVHFAYTSQLYAGGGESVVRVFDSADRRCYSLTHYATPLDVTFDTGDIQLFDGHRAMVLSVRPLENMGTSVPENELYIATRDHLLDAAAPTFGSAETYNSTTGAFDVRRDGRYHRFRRVARGSVGTSTYRPRFFGLDIERAVKTGRK